TFSGVYLPGVLAVFGVIIYLRLGWIVGAVGFYQVFAIISIAFGITFLTSLSIAAVATNMRVGQGGTYYIVSRSFGIEIGSAIGLALYVAGTLTVAFCTIGFAESLHSILPMLSIQTISVSTLVVLAALVYVSNDAAMKAQFVIFLLIGVSLVSLFMGKYIPMIEETPVVETLSIHPFWAVFAIFFPAATGIETGVAMSGNLKNPRRSLPLGTLAIVATAYIVYVAIAYFLSSTVPRQVLVKDPMIVLNIAHYKPFVLIGIWAATLSSAIGGLMAAPQTLQAIAKDGILPKFLAKGYGPANEPRIAGILTFAIALGAVYFGSIDIIAPYLTMFALVAYAMLNLGCGLESFLGNPSWRPSFQVPASIPLIGCALCLIVMLMIDAGGALIAMAIIFITYAYIKSRSKGRNWDDIRSAVLRYMCRYSIYKLINAPSSPKSWRPNFLVFSRSPTQSTAVFKMASAITRGRGFLTLAAFMQETETGKTLHEWQSLVSGFLEKQQVPAIVKINPLEKPLDQMQDLIRNYGLGPVAPNTIVMGIPENGNINQEWINVLQAAKAQRRNVLLIGESIQEPSANKIKQLDLWWENDQRKSSELMLLLSLLLSRHPDWKKHQIHLKSIVSAEDARASREQYFSEFIEKTRLSFETHVLVIPERTDHVPAFGRFSKNADAVFITLPDDLDLEHVKERLKLSKHVPLSLFILCNEDTDFTQIFE
ncbi:MAG: amino acid permease, partial [Chlamydiia bacterium]|nr:amino acid permease [Chlamydiia bacterium]